MTNPTLVSMSARTLGLTVELQHDPSASRLETAPPRDNGGTGASFSPTDLVGAALLSCALTTMALVAAREGLAWGEAWGTVHKLMSPPPRRIAELRVVLQMPKEVRPEQRARLEEIARTCPVALSLSAELKRPIEFRY